MDTILLNGLRLKYVDPISKIALKKQRACFSGRPSFQIFITIGDLSAKIIKANIFLRDTHFIQHLQYRRVHQRRTA